MSRPDNNGRTPQARGLARRKEILDTATSMFAGGGFNSVSLADIAAAVGITQAGILHYFPTKAALLIAVLQEREASNERLGATVRTEGMDGLSTYFRTLALNEENPALVQLFVLLSAEALAEDHPGHDWFVQRNKRLVERMTGYVTDVVDVDRLPEGLDVQTIARWIMALSNGLGAQWLIDPSAFSRHEAVSKIMILLRPYLRDPSWGEGLS